MFEHDMDNTMTDPRPGCVGCLRRLTNGGVCPLAGRTTAGRCGAQQRATRADEKQRRA